MVRMLSKPSQLYTKLLNVNSIDYFSLLIRTLF